MTGVLSDRFRNDGKSSYNVTPQQERLINQIREKIRAGEYQFRQKDCCVCDSDQFDSLSEKDRYGIKHPVSVCKTCGLIQQTPVMTRETYDEFYNCEYWELYRNEYSGYEEFFQKQYTRGESILNYLESNFKQDLDSAKILDVGTGTGGAVAYLKDAGYQVTGCDLAEEPITYGRTEHNLELSVGDVSSIEIDDKPDVVIYRHVLEHIHNPVQELRRVRSRFGENVHIYVELPGVRYLYNSYNKDFLQMLQNAHIYYFTLRTLGNVAHKAGYEIVTGDETIQCLLAPGDNDNIVSDYPSIKQYLKWMEYYRHIPSRQRVGESLVNDRVVRLLKKTGTYSTTRKIYESIFM